MTTSDPDKSGQNVNNGHNANNGRNGQNPDRRGNAGQGSNLSRGNSFPVQPDGLLDERLLTQMANEMFKGSPDFLPAAEDIAANFEKPFPGTSMPSTSMPSTSMPSTSMPSTSMPSTSMPGAGAPLPGGSSFVPGMGTSLPATDSGIPGMNQIGTNQTGINPSGINPSMPGTGFSPPSMNQAMPGMFTSLPGTVTPGSFGLPAEIDPQRQLPGGTQGAGIGSPRTPSLVNEADFRQMPVGSGGGFGNGLNANPSTGLGAGNIIGASTSGSSPETFVNVPAGTIPGGFNLGDFTDVPSFSFLNEIRPILAYASGSGGNQGSSRPGFNNLSSAGNAQDPYRSYERLDVIPSTEPTKHYQSGALSNLNLLSTQFDVEAIRRDFPILQEFVNGQPLVWLDNAATTQKPQSVIDRLSYFYAHENSNVHRAAHELAARSTDAYERARDSVRRFLNASSAAEIVFVRGATEAINLVAQSWGRQNIQKDDEIVITHLEHHANIVPWQMLCAEKGARLRVAPVDDHGQIILEQYERLLNPKTKFVSITQVSNALGTVTPIKPMIDSAHRYGAKVLVDGAQAVSHMQVDMQAYDCDFYVFSGHKVFAPTGIGVLYGKSSILESMAPWQGGGNMIKDVTFEQTSYQSAPLRFEAGTGSIADAVGLGAAIEYLERIGMANISRHEHELLVYGTEGLKRIPGLHLVGTAAEKAGVLSFVLDGFQTEEVSSSLNQRGIAVRGGHHCAQPILRRFNLESTVRPSLALYNTCEDIDALIEAVWDLKQGRNPGPL